MKKMMIIAAAVAAIATGAHADMRGACTAVSLAGESAAMLRDSGFNRSQTRALALDAMAQTAGQYTTAHAELADSLVMFAFDLMPNDSPNEVKKAVYGLCLAGAA